MSGRSQRYLFEDFITDSEGALSNEALLVSLHKFMAGHGYDRIIFNDFRAPTFAHSNLDLNGLPSEFWRYYADNNCASFDPIYLRLRLHQAAFRWNGTDGMTHLSKKQHAFMKHLADLGLCHGVALPLRGRRGMEAVMGVSSSRPINGGEPSVALLEAVATQFYTAYLNLNTGPREDLDIRGTLSSKEQDVLSWMAVGKTDDEIAAILSITRSTVNAHGRNIFRKLEVHTRVRAVVVGIMRGQIQL